MSDWLGDADLLTPDARRAIRSYVLRLFIPSAVGISIISAIAGYAFNSIIRSSAYNDAYREFIGQIQAAAMSVATSEGQVKIALTNAQASSDLAKKSADEIQQNSAKVQALASQDYSKISSELLKDVNFKTSLASVSQDVIGVQERKIATLEGFFANLQQNTTVTEGGPPSGSSQCPPGSYAVGFNFLSSPGGAHGILYAGQITCRSFTALSQ